MRSYSYRLPWPPSVNNYIRRAANRSYMTKQGKAFRGEVCDTILGEETLGTLTGRLAVFIELIPPDRRKRDIDNHVKAVLDAMIAAGVMNDDSQVDELQVKRLHVEAPGACDVTITEIEPLPTE